MTTQNICFHGEIEKIMWILLLPRAMTELTFIAPCLTGKGTTDHLNVCAAGQTAVQSWSVFIFKYLGGAGPV